MIAWLSACSSWTIENAIQGEVAPEETPPSPTTTAVPETLSLPPGGPIPVRSCFGPCNPESPAWDVGTEWRVDYDPYPTGKTSMPVVAHLDDDDGDGGVGSAGDLPEVVVFANDAGLSRLRARRSDGTPFRVYDQALWYQHAPAVADLDHSGLPEIVVVTAFMEVAAITSDGETLWTSESLIVEDRPFSVCTVAIVDLEGDGRAEVLCDPLVLDGATGETRWRNPTDDVFFGVPTVADLDLDGLAEVVFDNEVYRADGTLWWRTDPDGGGVFPAVVQLDDDPEGELVTATGGSLSGWDTDGTQLWRTQMPDSAYSGSPPCLADFDGDGEIEIAAAFATRLGLFERDGTLVWSRPIDDPSTAAGCSAFDFDLDGRAEIAYADETSFALYCGVDGSALFEDPSHQSVTLVESPVVADLDRDGSAEVVVGVGAELSGVVVYGNPAWPATGSLFPQLDYRSGTQDDDGTITGETASWLGDGLVRSRIAEGPITPPPLATELSPSVADQIGGCDGLSLAVQIDNRGEADAPAGQILEVHAIDAMALGEIATHPVSEVSLPAIPSGTRSDAIRVDLGADAVGPFGALLRIPAREGLPECDATNQDAVVQLRCE